MSTVATPHFLCPTCKRKNAWKPSFAGKRAKCACGSVVTVPKTATVNGKATGAKVPVIESRSALQSGTVRVTPGLKPREAAAIDANEGSGIFSIAQEGAEIFQPAAAVIAPPVDPTMPKRPARAAAAVAAPAASARANAVAAAAGRSVMGGVPVRKGLSTEPVVEKELVPAVLRDVVLPLAMIAVGLYLAVADATRANDGTALALAKVAPALVISVIAGLGLAVTAVLAGSAMAGIAFSGPMWQNLLKLCAIALLPLPAGSLVGKSIGGINGDIASSFVAIALYCAGFWAVFKMAWSDRAVCVLLIWIIRSGVAYAMFKIGGMMSGADI